MKKYNQPESVSLYNAKTTLSALVDRVGAGEEFVITKSGKPRALLVPLRNTRSLRTPGKGRYMWSVRRDFDAPLTEDMTKLFGAPEE